MVETRLRWFVHVERIPVDSVVTRVDQMDLEKRKRNYWEGSRDK